MTDIHERVDLRNRVRVFRDRFDAGRVLGRMLEPDLGGTPGGLLLGIPMGGVPVASEMALLLNLPMDLVVVRKIQIPGNPEAGFGAMTDEGDLFLNRPLMSRLKLDKAAVERQKDKVRRELEARRERLRGGRPLPDLKGRTVVLVDDGLASGLTLKAAVFMAGKRRAAKTVVAVPTAPRRTLEALGADVAAVYCANVRDVQAFAVAEAYQDWSDLSEADVTALVAAAGGAGTRGPETA